MEYMQLLTPRKKLTSIRHDGGIICNPIHLPAEVSPSPKESERKGKATNH